MRTRLLSSIVLASLGAVLYPHAVMAKKYCAVPPRGEIVESVPTQRVPRSANPDDRLEETLRRELSRLENARRDAQARDGASRPSDLESRVGRLERDVDELNKNMLKVVDILEGLRTQLGAGPKK